MMDAKVSYPLRVRLFYFFPILFAFFLPFGSLLLSGLILVWGVVSFFNIHKNDFVAGLSNRSLHLLWLFFILTVVSAFMSANKEEALFNIETKLTFLFFPYYFFCFRWPGNLIKRCLVSFVSGCFFACLVLLIRAAVFALKGNPDYFFYTLFSDFIHASHFSIYLIFASAIIMVYYPVWFKEHKGIQIASYFFLLVFTVSIFLCSSKTGILSLAIVYPLLFAYRYRNHFNYRKAIIAVLILLIAFFVMAGFLGGPFERLRSLTSVSLSSIDKTSSESTGVRILIWEQCLNLISENPLTGVGVGDVNEELMRAYEKNGMTGALQHHLNAHNQYLQTFVGMGIAGFIVLLLLTWYQLARAFIQKYFVFFVFMLLIVFNFFVESMLQRSDGILFFIFFFCLLKLKASKDEIKI